MSNPLRTGAIIIGAEIVLAASFGVSGMIGWHGTANASPMTPAPAIVVTVTVDGIDYPLCAEEDCSDQPNSVGVWRNDGRDWLIIGENTYPVTQ